MVNFTIMSNVWLSSFLHLYFGMLHVYFTQYYFFEISHRIISLHTSTNKFGISFVYAIFMAVPIICACFINIEKTINKNCSVFFLPYLLGIICSFLCLKKPLQPPKVKRFLGINVFIGFKELLFRMYISDANVYLNTVANIMIFLILFQMIVEKCLLFYDRWAIYGKKEPINLRQGGKNRIPVRQPDENNDSFRVRRRAFNINSINVFPMKKYLNVLFFAFEVLFDNLFLFHHTKKQNHILNIKIRAVISPILFTVLGNTVFETRDMLTYLVSVSVSAILGVLNFVCIRKPKYYRFLMVYNFVLVCLIEFLLVKTILIDSTLYKNVFVKNILVDLMNIIQISIPIILSTISGVINGLEGIVITSNVIAYTMCLVFYSTLTNAYSFVQKCDALSNPLKVDIAFQMISAVFPFVTCLFFKKYMVNELGFANLIILGCYYILKDWALKNK
ncbi:hypothetical protein EHP00_404 [Ecytonucleospora hepatopenaei]|uniref:Uncharacterized protein n=1 Tax=Ecytonucleospora hepatopenaei TaxID=646526 RepID=A0A1W0E9D3_9MICR|nr:hypothetical protein EHP00_404 [Ecytonucleospora hepatopenaei]